MSASAIFVVVVLLFVGCGLLTWISIRGASRAASIEEIAARMARAASKARAKGTTLLERHVDFDYYDVDGEAQLPHLICLAMQDVVMEAERLYLRAIEAREGRQMLPLDLQVMLEEAFGKDYRIDPVTGEIIVPGLEPRMPGDGVPDPQDDAGTVSAAVESADEAGTETEAD